MYDNFASCFSVMEKKKACLISLFKRLSSGFSKELPEHLTSLQGALEFCHLLISTDTQTSRTLTVSPTELANYLGWKLGGYEMQFSKYVLEKKDAQKKEDRKDILKKDDKKDLIKKEDKEKESTMLQEKDSTKKDTQEGKTGQDKKEDKEESKEEEETDKKEKVVVKEETLEEGSSEVKDEVIEKEGEVEVKQEKVDEVVEKKKEEEVKKELKREEPRREEEVQERTHPLKLLEQTVVVSLINIIGDCFEMDSREIMAVMAWRFCRHFIEPSNWDVSFTFFVYVQKYNQSEISEPLYNHYVI